MRSNTCLVYSSNKVSLRRKWNGGRCCVVLLFSPLSQAASTLLRALKQGRLREYLQSAATSFDTRWKPSCSAVLARVNHWRHRLQPQPGCHDGTLRLVRSSRLALSRALPRD